MFRKEPIVTGSIYHIFNRGVNKGGIFFEDKDYKRFLSVAVHYKTQKRQFSHISKAFSSISDPVSEYSPKVEIFGYCLMPNHFHFLIKQLTDGGITSYMQHVANSYSHYVHIKYKRTGPLFESRFKNVCIENDDQFVHVLRYICLNPFVSGLVSNLRQYPHSSYLGYIGEMKDDLSESDLGKISFKSKEDFERFVLDQADYGRELEKIKHLVID